MSTAVTITSSPLTDGQVLREYRPDRRARPRRRSLRTRWPLLRRLPSPPHHHGHAGTTRRTRHCVPSPEVVPFPRGFAFAPDGRIFLASGMGPSGIGEKTIKVFGADGDSSRPPWSRIRS